ncbi:MAG: ATP-binding protein [Solirubrobacteraceae bacterium]
MNSISTVDNTRGVLDELRADMDWLDEALSGALDQTQRAFGARGEDRRFAGLVITHDEPKRLLSRPLAELPFGPLTPAGNVAWRNRRLERAARACELTDFDTAVLLMATAPEIDLRYERIYAYLQDDVTRRRPTVALALDLLAADAHEKLTLRRRFLPDAPLRRHGLVQLVADHHPAPPPLLSHALLPTDGVVRFLLGEPALDESLLRCADLQLPGGHESDQRLRLPEALRDHLIALGANDDARTKCPVVLVEGGDTAEHQAVASAVAFGARRALLTVDLAGVPDTEMHTALTAAHGAAVLHGAVIHVLGSADATTRDAALLLDGTAVAVADLALARAIGHHDRADVRVAIPRIDFNRRRELCATTVGKAVRSPDVSAAIGETLARRFRLSPRAIEEVAETATSMARSRSTAAGDPSEPTMDDFMEAAREATRLQLGGLARRISPRRGRAQLILPADRFALLDAIRTHVVFAETVSDEWGFARTMTRGIVALFSGPPGTGKTLAAEVLAGELGLDLYAIDLSQVVSKYIGETEKNLARVFDEAERSSAVLFFDEADALFGARGEVRDAHDRYANIEISYLLQRMEQYCGLAVLASNLQRNIDEAFLRRVRFVVSFPLPDADSRRRIWEATWPPEAPSSDLDYQDLAARFDVTGATIRDAAVGAAFLAAAENGVATMAHVEEAMNREYAKLGRLPARNGQWTSDLQPPAANPPASTSIGAHIP